MQNQEICTDCQKGSLGGAILWGLVSLAITGIIVGSVAAWWIKRK